MICADNGTSPIVPKKPLVLSNKDHALPNYISMRASLPFYTFIWIYGK
jgi:hypothetical protein